LVNAYGMTEFGGSVVMVDPADGDDARLATQGPPFPGLEVGIRDEANRPLPAGERGEIVIRGPSMFGGYHNDPAKTAEAVDAAGWYHSGDLGTVGADGRLRYLGRLKDMLKVGGENVAALEIASHLQAHPCVCVAQVVGVADEKYGEQAMQGSQHSPPAMRTPTSQPGSTSWWANRSWAAMPPSAHNAAAAAARPSPVTRRDASAERVVSSLGNLPRQSGRVHCSVGAMPELTWLDATAQA